MYVCVYTKHAKNLTYTILMSSVLTYTVLSCFVFNLYPSCPSLRLFLFLNFPFFLAFLYVLPVFHVTMPSLQPLWWSCWWLFCIYFCWPSHCDGSFVSCTSSWRKTLFSLQTAWRDSFANLFLLLVFESLASLTMLIGHTYELLIQSICLTALFAVLFDHIGKIFKDWFFFLGCFLPLLR